MSDRRLLDEAIQHLEKNAEQLDAVRQKGHCVVLAGPGSGKTKTLTVAIARTLLEDVLDPRGIACITYNNETAAELETRLDKLGIEPSFGTTVGTVHSFALAQIIAPYARCVLPELADGFQVATREQCRAAVEDAYKRAIRQGENPHSRWRFAETKRRSQVDRTNPDWNGKNPELARFIESYEEELRRNHLIDFDDMPLLAFRMLQSNPWIGNALSARYPVLFVDEYQDLGHALHELVLKLCFEHGIRLFAVGDADQSIYGFTGANPNLLKTLSERQDVHTVRLKLNYRCGSKIISASMAALGEERGYNAPDGAGEGEVLFHGTTGGLEAQAKDVIEQIVLPASKKDVPLHEIAVLYRTAEHGNAAAAAAIAAGLPIVRSDNQALVKRNSRLSRLIESCARWAAGGWKTAEPRFQRLASDATALVYGAGASVEERHEIEIELVAFLQKSIESKQSANDWLKTFRTELIGRWRKVSRISGEDWRAIDEMVERTDIGGQDSDLTLARFGGFVEDGGRLNLSTLHSAKGREFDVVALFAMNSDILPTWRDSQRQESLTEARRLFYVGVTRARKLLYVCFQKNNNSPWVKALYDRLKAET